MALETKVRTFSLVEFKGEQLPKKREEQGTTGQRRFWFEGGNMSKLDPVPPGRPAVKSTGDPLGRGSGIEPVVLGHKKGVHGT